MDEHLKRKRSEIGDDGFPRGCMGGLFQFLDFNQRLHVRKLLVYHKRSGDGRRHGRSRSPKAKQNVMVDEEYPPDEDKSIRVEEDKRKISRSDSNKVLKRSINSNRRHSVHDLMQATTSQNMHLLRTYSIHHLDPDDYLDNQNQTQDHQTKLNYNVPEHVLEKHRLLREKLVQAKEALSVKKNVSPYEIEKDTEFHQSKEFMDMMRLFNNNRELLLKVLKHSDVFERFLDSQKKASNDTNANKKINDEISSKENQTTSSHFKVLRKRIKDVINENNKEGHRISMDGLLHKVPYGSKLSKNEMKEKKGTTDRNNSRNKGIKRSHSLNESLDKYSQLLETISSTEEKTNSEKLKLENKRKPEKTLGRIFSLPDFDSTSLRKDDQRAFDMGQSLKIPVSVDIYDKRDSKSVVSTNSAEAKTNSEKLKLENKRKPEKTLGRIFSLPDFDSTSLRKDDQRAFDMGQSLKIPISVDIYDKRDSKSVDVSTDSAESSLEEQNLLSNIEMNSLENVSDTEIISVPGSLELVQDALYPSSHNSIQLDDTNFADSDLLQVSSDELDRYYDFFNFQPPATHAPQFNYVRDILWKSGFGTDDFLKAWHSPNQPIDPVIFEESDDAFRENQLLFDLVNEVLLEIYDGSCSYCPWLSRFGTSTRPVPPSGRRVLEEVWARVSWYLDSQFYEYDTLDLGVANDFKRKDGWMDILFDCEVVGLELEDWIFDDLLDEVVTDLFE